MPSRPSRPSQRLVSLSKDYTHAIAYHSSAITIFWVLFLFLSLGFGILSLTYYVKLNQQELKIQELNRLLLKSQIGASAQPKNLITSSKPVEISVTIPSASGTKDQAYNSPYAMLVRGALSPDGTKYAGYDDTTTGKLGVGVITLADKRVRHIVLFDTRIESSGAEISTGIYGTIGVRWTDDKTIQYDVMVKKAAGLVKETRTVKIGF